MAKRPSRTPHADRLSALVLMRERHPLVAAHFAETHGLRLSEQVMLLAAFFKSLNETELEAVRTLGIAPFGVTRWFDEKGLERRLLPGLDARLHGRFSCDPPEVVTIMSGHADGLHFGLFYDEPKKLPWLLTQNYARDTGVTEAASGIQRTVLDYLHVLVRRCMREGMAVAALLPALEELAEASADVVSREQPKRLATIERLKTISGTGPYLPKSMPHSTSWPQLEVRRQAYRSNDPIVGRWISEARSELSTGAPGFALMLGRDLFFLRNRWQDEAVELLDGGYRALDRGALAEIVRVHAKHRDLRSVDVYER